MALVGNSHLVAGDSSAVADVLARLHEEGIDTEKNPDVYVRSYTHFGVDDARELRERADLSAQGQRRVFVLSTPVMTAEAQNALLKTFEEPPGNALFILVVPAPETLLSTLRSRMQRLDVGTAAHDGGVEGGAFLSASPVARLDMIKPLLEKGDDERRDISSIVMFLSTLERALEKTPRRASREGLAAIYRARAFMADKGSLLKPLLEQVALLVPRVKP
ncbi:MAG: DNA polymerase III subunit gamma/tau [Parcubacteria group bacterium Athens0416_74]|nr:MAG: DNA polymerase III subunit gamma/tau [Parcubacteria group bacterium Athens0416_74]